MLIKFNWLIWGALLALTAILGSFSGVNSNGTTNFFASVAYGIRHGDVLLILCAILTAVLLLWLLLALVTGSLTNNQQGNQPPRL